MSTYATGFPDLTGPPPWKCPKCGGKLLDLREQGFNAEAVRREGLCFLFENVFECVVREGADGQPFESNPNHPLDPDYSETPDLVVGGGVLTLGPRWPRR